MANKYIKALSAFFMVMVGSAGFAQGPPPPPPPLPIDGGIIGLLILGVGFAIKKINDQTRK